MKWTTFLLYCLPGFAAVIQAQPAIRSDAVWARSTAGAQITLDGVLNEPAWAQAESIRVQYQSSSEIIPGSGWWHETGVEPSDPTDATLKFLAADNWLYLGIVCKDSSVGGGLFNRFDGFLMNLRAHEQAARPAPSFEYFYAWVTEPWADPATGEVGASPGFFGMAGGPRDSITANIWNAATTVQGLSNADSIIDASYVSEIAINLTPRGYDVTNPQGDILEFNISIYDADWQWPFQIEKFSGNRTWLQGPWGNASFYSVLRIYARPEVTVNSGLPPMIGPEVIVPNGGNYPDPTIDGQLNEAVWQAVPGYDIRFGDEALRASYPGVGAYRSGQYQPAINGIIAAVLDPGDATVRWFFKGDMLYVGVDVRDQAVWSLPAFEQWDGFQMIINDRAVLNPSDHSLERRELAVRFEPDGSLVKVGYLATLIDDLQGGQVALAMKPNTTINNFNDVDEGFQIEFALDLTKLGYPPGRGDGTLFISAALYDGDSFANPLDDYGTRTWWFRDNASSAAPAWAYMDPTVDLSSCVMFDFPVAAGAWYLISLSVVPADNSVNTLFPGAAGAFGWDFASQNYVPAANLEPGKAYWLLMLQPQTVEVCGEFFNTYTHNYATAGWDLTGSVLATSSLVDEPDQSVLAMFGWDAATGQYETIAPFTVEPKQGYWILVFNTPCTISAGSGAVAATTVQASPNAELAAFQKQYGTLPPSPPYELTGNKFAPLPASYGLSQNYPNPFNPETVIEYQLPEAGRVSLKIYDMMGREVRTLVLGEQSAGYHRVKWDGRNDQGQKLNSGLYLYRIHAGNFVQTRKVVLLK